MTPEPNLNDNQAPEAEAGLKGIAGWLLLPALALIVSPMVSVAELIGLVRLLTQNETPVNSSIVCIGVLINLGLFAFTVYVATRFFRTKRDAPKTIIALIATNIVVGIVAAVMLASKGALGEQYITSMARDWISAAIWIPYFLVSKRVKATFVN